ncbi:MAG: hypothetical protein ACYDIA_01860 [Candidatus Humimicrobiaceae bacterium]
MNNNEFIDTTPYHPMLDENLATIRQLKKENYLLKIELQGYKDFVNRWQNAQIQGQEK